jgi:hypothetical protein
MSSVIVLLLLVACCLFAATKGAVQWEKSEKLQKILDLACVEGNLEGSLAMVNEILYSGEGIIDETDENGAAMFHVKSALELIRNGDYLQAVVNHRQGKNINSTIVPPLAQLNLDGNKCGGIGDIFYVAAVIIKQTVDKIAENPLVVKDGLPEHDADSLLLHEPSSEFMIHLQDGYQTLITLTSDAGLHRECDQLVQAALTLLEMKDLNSDYSVYNGNDNNSKNENENENENDDSNSERKKGLSDTEKSYYNSLKFRNALLTPAVYESVEHLETTRQQLIGNLLRIDDESFKGIINNITLDEFVVSPTFYYVYQGYQDQEVLRLLNNAYNNANQDLGVNHLKNKDPLLELESANNNDSNSNSKPLTLIRVGFVSAHYRRHSICKLFCGSITSLSNDPRFQITLFSALQENREDSTTKSLIEHIKSSNEGRQKDENGSSGNRHEFVRIGKTLVSNRYEVLNRNIDVLIYLDVGMDPATMIWAGSRLAPFQACLWGHPTTTGMAHMDYFISSNDYHIDNEMKFIKSPQYHNKNKNEYDDIREGNNDDATIPTFTNAEDNKVVNDNGDIVLMSDSSPYSSYSYERFSEQLIMFDTLGFTFVRPHIANIPSFSGMESYDTLADRKDDYYSQLITEINKKLKPAKPTPSASVVKGDKSNLSKLSKVPKNEKSLITLRSLIEDKSTNKIKLALCPQHLPKLHSDMDEVFKGILEKNKKTRIILVYDSDKKQQWRRTLENRWKLTIGDNLIKNRIIWLENLKPQEYLILLSIGDMMLDPFPFGGGVTTLESLSVCTPVITLPSKQTVPSLAAGQLRTLATGNDMPYLNLNITDIDTYDANFLKFINNELIVEDVNEYINKVNWFLNDKQNKNMKLLRKEICQRSDRLYDVDEVADDWKEFLLRLK